MYSSVFRRMVCIVMDFHWCAKFSKEIAFDTVNLAHGITALHLVIIPLVFKSTAP